MAVWNVIDHTELSGNATSIEFTGISGSYDHLCLKASLRVDSSGQYWQYGKLQLGNGSADTGSNYSMTALYSSNTGIEAGRSTGDTWIDTWSLVGPSALADTFGAIASSRWCLYYFGRTAEYR